MNAHFMGFVLALLGLLGTLTAPDTQAQEYPAKVVARAKISDE